MGFKSDDSENGVQSDLHHLSKNPEMPAVRNNINNPTPRRPSVSPTRRAVEGTAAAAQKASKKAISPSAVPPPPRKTAAAAARSSPSSKQPVPSAHSRSPQQRAPVAAVGPRKKPGNNTKSPASAALPAVGKRKSPAAQPTSRVRYHKVETQAPHREIVHRHRHQQQQQQQRPDEDENDGSESPSAASVASSGALQVVQSGSARFSLQPRAADAPSLVHRQHSSIRVAHDDSFEQYAVDYGKALTPPEQAARSERQHEEQAKQDRITTLQQEIQQLREQHEQIMSDASAAKTRYQHEHGGGGRHERKQSFEEILTHNGGPSSRTKHDQKLLKERREMMMQRKEQQHQNQQRKNDTFAGFDYDAAAAGGGAKPLASLLPSVRTPPVQSANSLTARNNEFGLISGDGGGRASSSPKTASPGGAGVRTPPPAQRTTLPPTRRQQQHFGGSDPHSLDRARAELQDRVASFERKKKPTQHQQHQIQDDGGVVDEGRLYEEEGDENYRKRRQRQLQLQVYDDVGENYITEVRSTDGNGGSASSPAVAELRSIDDEINPLTPLALREVQGEQRQQEREEVIVGLHRKSRRPKEHGLLPLERQRPAVAPPEPLLEDSAARYAFSQQPRVSMERPNSNSSSTRGREEMEEQRQALLRSLPAALQEFETACLAAGLPHIETAQLSKIVPSSPNNNNSSSRAEEDALRYKLLSQHFLPQVELLQLKREEVLKAIYKREDIVERTVFFAGKHLKNEWASPTGPRLFKLAAAAEASSSSSGRKQNNNAGSSSAAAFAGGDDQIEDETEQQQQNLTEASNPFINKHTTLYAGTTKIDKITAAHHLAELISLITLASEHVIDCIVQWRKVLRRKFPFFVLDERSSEHRNYLLVVYEDVDSVVLPAWTFVCKTLHPSVLAEIAPSPLLAGVSTTSRMWLIGELAKSGTPVHVATTLGSHHQHPRSSLEPSPGRRAHLERELERKRRQSCSSGSAMAGDGSASLNDLSINDDACSPSSAEAADNNNGKPSSFEQRAAAEEDIKKKYEREMELVSVFMSEPAVLQILYNELVTACEAEGKFLITLDFVNHSVSSYDDNDGDGGSPAAAARNSSSDDGDGGAAGVLPSTEILTTAEINVVQDACGIDAEGWVRCGSPQLAQVILQSLKRSQAALQEWWERKMTFRLPKAPPSSAGSKTSHRHQHHQHHHHQHQRADDTMRRQVSDAADIYTHSSPPKNRRGQKDAANDNDNSSSLPEISASASPIPLAPGQQQQFLDNSAAAAAAANRHHAISLNWEIVEQQVEQGIISPRQAEVLWRGGGGLTPDGGWPKELAHQQQQQQDEEAEEQQELQQPHTPPAAAPRRRIPTPPPAATAALLHAGSKSAFHRKSATSAAGQHEDQTQEKPDAEEEEHRQWISQVAADTQAKPPRKRLGAIRERQLERFMLRSARKAIFQLWMGFAAQRRLQCTAQLDLAALEAEEEPVCRRVVSDEEAKNRTALTQRMNLVVSRILEQVEAAEEERQREEEERKQREARFRIVAIASELRDAEANAGQAGNDIWAEERNAWDAIAQAAASDRHDIEHLDSVQRDQKSARAAMEQQVADEAESSLAAEEGAERQALQLAIAHCNERCVLELAEQHFSTLASSSSPVDPREKVMGASFSFSVSMAEESVKSNKSEDPSLVEKKNKLVGEFGTRSEIEFSRSIELDFLASFFGTVAAAEIRARREITNDCYADRSLLSVINEEAAARKKTLTAPEETAWNGILSRHRVTSRQARMESNRLDQLASFLNGQEQAYRALLQEEQRDRSSFTNTFEGLRDALAAQERMRRESEEMALELSYRREEQSKAEAEFNDAALRLGQEETAERGGVVQMEVYERVELQQTARAGAQRVAVEQEQRRVREEQQRQQEQQAEAQRLEGERLQALRDEWLLAEAAKLEAERQTAVDELKLQELIHFNRIEESARIDLDQMERRRSADEGISEVMLLARAKAEGRKADHEERVRKESASLLRDHGHGASLLADHEEAAHDRLAFQIRNFEAQVAEELAARRRAEHATALRREHLQQLAAVEAAEGEGRSKNLFDESARAETLFDIVSSELSFLQQQAAAKARDSAGRIAAELESLQSKQHLHFLTDVRDAEETERQQFQAQFAQRRAEIIKLEEAAAAATAAESAKQQEEEQTMVDPSVAASRNQQKDDDDGLTERQRVLLEYLRQDCDREAQRILDAESEALRGIESQQRSEIILVERAVARRTEIERVHAEHSELEAARRAEFEGRRDAVELEEMQQRSRVVDQETAVWDYLESNLRSERSAVRARDAERIEAERNERERREAEQLEHDAAVAALEAQHLGQVARLVEREQLERDEVSAEELTAFTRTSISQKNEAVAVERALELEMHSGRLKGQREEILRLEQENLGAEYFAERDRMVAEERREFAAVAAAARASEGDAEDAAGRRHVEQAEDAARSALESEAATELESEIRAPLLAGLLLFDFERAVTAIETQEAAQRAEIEQTDEPESLQRDVFDPAVFDLDALAEHTIQHNVLVEESGAWAELLQLVLVTLGEQKQLEAKQRHERKEVMVETEMEMMAAVDEEEDEIASLLAAMRGEFEAAQRAEIDGIQRREAHQRKDLADEQHAGALRLRQEHRDRVEAERNRVLDVKNQKERIKQRIAEREAAFEKKKEARSNAAWRAGKEDGLVEHQAIEARFSRSQQSRQQHCDPQHLRMPVRVQQKKAKNETAPPPPPPAAAAQQQEDVDQAYKDLFDLARGFRSYGGVTLEELHRIARKIWPAHKNSSAVERAFQYANKEVDSRLRNEPAVIPSALELLHAFQFIVYANNVLPLFVRVNPVGSGFVTRSEFAVTLPQFHLYDIEQLYCEMHDFTAAEAERDPAAFALYVAHQREEQYAQSRRREHGIEFDFYMHWVARKSPFVDAPSAEIRSILGIGDGAPAAGDSATAAGSTPLSPSSSASAKAATPAAGTPGAVTPTRNRSPSRRQSTFMRPISPPSEVLGACSDQAKKMHSALASIATKEVSEYMVEKRRREAEEAEQRRRQRIRDYFAGLPRCDPDDLLMPGTKAAAMSLDDDAPPPAAAAAQQQRKQPTTTAQNNELLAQKQILANLFDLASNFEPRESARLSLKDFNRACELVWPGVDCTSCMIRSFNLLKDPVSNSIINVFKEKRRAAAVSDQTEKSNSNNANANSSSSSPPSLEKHKAQQEDALRIALQFVVFSNNLAPIFRSTVDEETGHGNITGEQFSECVPLFDFFSPEQALLEMTAFLRDVVGVELEFKQPQQQKRRPSAVAGAAAASASSRSNNNKFANSGVSYSHEDFDSAEAQLRHLAVSYDLFILWLAHVRPNSVVSVQDDERDRRRRVKNKRLEVAEKMHGELGAVGEDHAAQLMSRGGAQRLIYKQEVGSRFARAAHIACDPDRLVMPSMLKQHAAFFKSSNGNGSNGGGESDEQRDKRLSEFYQMLFDYARDFLDNVGVSNQEMHLVSRKIWPGHKNSSAVERAFQYARKDPQGRVRDSCEMRDALQFVVYANNMLPLIPFINPVGVGKVSRDEFSVLAVAFGLVKKKTNSSSGSSSTSPPPRQQQQEQEQEAEQLQRDLDSAWAKMYAWLIADRSAQVSDLHERRHFVGRHRAHMQSQYKLSDERNSTYGTGISSELEALGDVKILDLAAVTHNDDGNDNGPAEQQDAAAAVASASSADFIEFDALMHFLSRHCHFVATAGSSSLKRRLLEIKEQKLRDRRRSVAESNDARKAAEAHAKSAEERRREAITAYFAERPPLADLDRLFLPADGTRRAKLVADLFDLCTRWQPESGLRAKAFPAACETLWRGFDNAAAANMAADLFSDREAGRIQTQGAFGAALQFVVYANNLVAHFKRTVDVDTLKGHVRGPEFSSCVQQFEFGANNAAAGGGDDDGDDESSSARAAAAETAFKGMRDFLHHELDRTLPTTCNKGKPCNSSAETVFVPFDLFCFYLAHVRPGFDVSVSDEEVAKKRARKNREQQQQQQQQQKSGATPPSSSTTPEPGGASSVNDLARKQRITTRFVQFKRANFVEDSSNSNGSNRILILPPDENGTFYGELFELCRGFLRTGGMVENEFFDAATKVWPAASVSQSLLRRAFFFAEKTAAAHRTIPHGDELRTALLFTVLAHNLAPAHRRVDGESGRGIVTRAEYVANHKLVPAMRSDCRGRAVEDPSLDFKLMRRYLSFRFGDAAVTSMLTAGGGAAAASANNSSKLVASKRKESKHVRPDEVPYDLMCVWLSVRGTERAGKYLLQVPGSEQYDDEELHGDSQPRSSRSRSPSKDTAAAASAAAPPVAAVEAENQQPAAEEDDDSKQKETPLLASPLLSSQQLERAAEQAAAATADQAQQQQQQQVEEGEMQPDREDEQQEEDPEKLAPGPRLLESPEPQAQPQHDVGEEQKQQQQQQEEPNSGQTQTPLPSSPSPPSVAELIAALRSLHERNSVLLSLSQIGSPTDSDLAELDAAKENAAIFKLQELAPLIQRCAVGCDDGQQIQLENATGDDVVELGQEVFEHLLTEGDHTPGNAAVVGAMLEHLRDALRLTQLAVDKGFLSVAAFDGNLEFLRLFFETTFLPNSSSSSFDQLDFVDIFQNGMFSQSRRIPVTRYLLQILNANKSKLHTVVEETADALREFFNDICSQKKLIPKEDQSGRAELIVEMLQDAVVAPVLDVPSFESGDGQTVFSRAAQEGDVDLMKLLLSNCPARIDINRVSTAKMTALIHAVLANSAEAVLFLLSLDGIDISHKSDEGDALFLAEGLRRDERIVQALLEKQQPSAVPPREAADANSADAAAADDPPEVAATRTGLDYADVQAIPAASSAETAGDQLPADAALAAAAAADDVDDGASNRVQSASSTRNEPKET